jgi:DNA-binding transcriptional ArsR family regulator
MGLLLCGKRRGVLCILASRAARGERTSVGEIARRLSLSQKNLSQHLASLRTSGLIYANRRGQHREYEINPARVVYERTENEDGGFKLHVFAARGSGVSVTIGWAVPMPAAQQTAATGPP